MRIGEETRYNLVTILKNAPKGLKLWCEPYGDVELEDINEDSPYPILLKINSDDNCGTVTAYGYLSNEYQDTTCVLWPNKEQHSWMEWQISLFKDGDIVCDTHNKCVWLLKVKEKTPYERTWNLSDGRGHRLEIGFFDIGTYRYATPEEKELFLATVEQNGYVINNRFNIVKPKQVEQKTIMTDIFGNELKVGDIIAVVGSHKQGFLVEANTIIHMSDKRIYYYHNHKDDDDKGKHHLVMRHRLLEQDYEGAYQYAKGMNDLWGFGYTTKNNCIKIYGLNK